MRGQDTNSSKCAQYTNNLWQGPEPLVHNLSAMLSVGSCGFLNLCIDMQGFEVSLADHPVVRLWDEFPETALREGAPLAFGHRPFGQPDQASAFISALT